jgi:hypothetical protein
LVPWWSRYILVPLISAAPGAFGVIWFGIHKNAESAYWLQGQEPWVLGAAALWAAVLSGAKSWANDLAQYTVTELKASRDELTVLLGIVRSVVTAKSRRFHEALAVVGADPHDGQVFRTITQPQDQIRKLVGAIYNYFRETAKEGEQIKVSLMEWEPTKDHMIFVDYFPDGDAPKTPENVFSDTTSAAGRALMDKRVVAIGNTKSDERYLKLHPQSKSFEGSMFAYPVEDDLAHQVIYVVNVISNRPGRFSEPDDPSITIPMEVFADRLVLENRLVRLKRRAVEPER